MRHWLMFTCVLCVLAGLPGAPASAQDVTAPAVLDEAARTAAVQAAAEALKAGYVYPEVGETAAHRLEDALESGSYDSLNEPEAFAARLTADLQAVAHDPHLGVFAPGAPASPEGGPPPRNEACVVRSDRLRGNIGYIEIVCLAPKRAAFRIALERALAPLINTKALVIDNRRNRGGGPEAEAYLASYLLPKDASAVVIDRFVSRLSGTPNFNTRDFSTSDTPFSFAGKPVYVLVSHETRLGGEALAYNLKVRHLALIAGEITSGGANPAVPAPLGAGLTLRLPYGRPENPVTRSNWEGVGVKPDIEVPAGEALKAVLQLLRQNPSGSGIDALSQLRYFTPRTLPQPGAAAAVRRIIAEHQGGPMEVSLFPHAWSNDPLADGAVDPLQLDEMFTQLGAIKSVSFDEVNDMGEDVYRVKLAHGTVKFMIMLAPDGSVADAGVWPAGPHD